MVSNVDSVRAQALRFWRFSRRTGIQEAVVVVIAFLVYFFIRGAVVDRAGEALANGLDLIALERATGMYWEIEWQSWIIDEYWAVRVMNWIYFWGHMPLVVALAIFLWVWHRSTYGLMRTAFLASGARTPSQAALRFCLAHPAVSTVVPGMMSVDQAADGVAALAAPPLSAAELERVRDIWATWE